MCFLICIRSSWVNMLTPADYGTVNTMGGGLLLVLAANLIYIALTPEKEKAAV